MGLICPVSRPFCRSCDRVWLTADGKLRGCLVDGGEVDVAADLRERIDVGNLTRTLRRVLSLKPAEHFASYRGRLNRIGG